tara:strand:+ start:26088 stop:26540 length:453 start_codon:yes stop_codon:yes gene_type:complete
MEKENKKPTTLQRFNSLFPLIAMFGGMSTVAGCIWWVSGYVTEQKGVTFTEPEIRVETEAYMKVKPSPVDLYIQGDKLLKATSASDSIFKFAKQIANQTTLNEQDAIVSRARRDSINREDSKKLTKITTQIEIIGLRQKLLERKVDSIKQ